MNFEKHYNFSKYLKPESYSLWTELPIGKERERKKPEIWETYRPSSSVSSSDKPKKIKGKGLEINPLIKGDLKDINFLIDLLFLAALVLHCCTGAFFSCNK